MLRDIFFQDFLEGAHLLLDFVEPLLRDAVQGGGQEHAVAGELGTIRAWLRLVAFELPSSTLEARCDHAIASAHLLRRGILVLRVTTLSRAVDVL